MKPVFLAVALIAGLSLTGCSGADSQTGSAEETDTAAKPTAEEPPQVTRLDVNQLKQIIESTEVDGRTFKTHDVGAVSGSEAAKADDTADYEPAECKQFSMAAPNATEAGNGTALSGVSSDSTMSVELISLADETAAGSQLAHSTELAEACSEVTVKSQGMETTMSYATFDVTVAGADESVRVRAAIDAGGKAVLNSDTVTSRVGDTIVTIASLADTADEQVVTTTAEEFVASVNNVG